ncbi:MAG: hypothetical protein RL072_1649 [Actinomycetota bacterium]
MTSYKTVFGSLKSYEKGRIEVINDDPKHYAFSNIFEVASKSKPFEKVAVALNQQYVLEAIRAEGSSSWYVCDHDETVICMDGEVRIDLVKPSTPIHTSGQDGAGLVNGDPTGKKMGHIVLRRGHQALLPRHCAYKFTATGVGALLQQTLLGPLTKQRWASICLS